MTQTSVASVWEPQLAERSLPGGMPWRDPDETPISEQAEQVLSVRQPSGTLLDEAWMLQPQESMRGRLPSADRSATGRLFRLERIAGGITVASIEPLDRPDDPDSVHRLIEQVKERVGIAWEPLLDVLNYPYRTYFTHRKERALPDSPVLAPSVRTLASLAARDATATALLLSVRHDEIRDLLRSAEFGRVRVLFHDIRRSLVGDRDEPTPLSIVAEHLDNLSRLAAEPAFAAAVRAIEGFLEQSGSFAGDRLLATVELESSLRAARSGDDLAAAWDFLPSLTFSAMDAVRARAEAYLESDEFTPDGWRALIAAEAQRAWDAYHPLVLPPDPVEPVPTSAGGGRRYRGPSVAERMSR